jgi:predicted acetyltransferase
MRLVLPNTKYEKVFFKDFLDYQKKPGLEWESWGKYRSKKVMKEDFKGFVKFLRSQSKGQNLPHPFWVPQTVYWFVQGQHFIGMLCLRHKLDAQLRKEGGHIGYEIAEKFRGKGYGNHILRLGLKKAASLGIKKALLTCDVTNSKSKKIIEKNGGIFEGTTKMKKGSADKLRYWIKI